MKRTLPFESIYQVVALFVAIIVVHLVYVTVVRPNADAILAVRAEQAAAGEAVDQERSLYVVMRDYEQESCFILGLWAIAIIGFKGRNSLRERRLLDAEITHVGEGMSILPEDTREYARPVQALPPPDLVVEIDRSRRSGYKLAPYFRMGVKEAWTSHRKDGVSIWAPDTGVAEGFRSVPASVVLPGLTAADLAPLCARGDPREQARHSRRLARRVAERMLGASGP